MKHDMELRGYRIGCSVLVLVLSILAAVVIVALRPEPETRPPREPEVVADLVPAVATNVVVEVTGHGVARPVRVVTLSSEVAGRIREMPERLDAGDRVRKGQILLQVDPKEYQAAVREAEATLARLEAALRRLDATEKTTRAQLEVSKRSRDLAEADFSRLTRLVEQGNAVSQAVAEAAERTLAQAQGQVLQLEQTLEFLPSQREETRAEREAASARLEQTQLQLERTTITAPFTGRIVTSMVEADAYVTPGAPLLELADDSTLEIQVPLASSELRQWIAFSTETTDAGWFPDPEPTEVSIEWTGSATAHQWTGTLDRIVSFDATTRTAMVAIRIQGEQLKSDQQSFPLTDGMFCRVRIPGKTLEGIFALPREAVSFDNKAYLSVDGRLKTVEVSVAWATEDSVYVSEGIQEGDLVVGTRLVAPLEGVKLRDSDG